MTLRKRRAQAPRKSPSTNSLRPDVTAERDFLVVTRVVAASTRALISASSAIAPRYPFGYPVRYPEIVAIAQWPIEPSEIKAEPLPRKQKAELVAGRNKQRRAGRERAREKLTG